MNRRRLVFFAFVSGATALACQIVAGIERVEKFDPPDAADVSPRPDTTPVPDPCTHFRPPAEPLVDDAPNEKIADIIIALRRLELVQKDGVPLAGFDLDNVCTCDTRPFTAREGGASCLSSKPVACDADGGVDNAVGTALRSFASFVDIDQAVRINKRIEAGTKTLLIALTSYNGRANDKEVGVGLFTSEGIRTPSPCPDSKPSEAGAFFTPGWCGEDTWTVSSNTVNASPDNIRFVPKALGSGYVTNYEFVVSLGGSAEIPFGGYKLTVSSGLARGRLVPLDAAGNPIDTSTNPDPSTISRWRMLDGILGGRIPVTELVAAMGTANIPGGDAASGDIPAVCSSVAIFPTIKQQICDAIDINTSARLDFSKDVVCDALSMAVTLTGEQARAKDLVPSEDASANDCLPTEDGGGPKNGPPGVTYRCD